MPCYISMLFKKKKTEPHLFLSDGFENLKIKAEKPTSKPFVDLIFSLEGTT